MNDLYVRGALCSFHNQYKNIRAFALKLSTLGLPLAMVLFCVCLAHAGQWGVGNPAAAGVALSTDSIKPLQIGNSIPSALWNMPLQMVKTGQGESTTVTLNDYKGKLIILDFWATWCGPCVGAIPKLDSLAKLFGDVLTIIPITDQDEPTVLNFLNNMLQSTDRKGSSIISAAEVHEYFPHHIIPHYVWIDQQGHFLGATDGSQLSKEDIEQVLRGKQQGFQLKNDPERVLNRNELLLADVNRIDKSKVLTHKLLSRYSPNLKPMLAYAHQENKPHRLYGVNVPLLWLYRAAYGEFKPEFANNSRVILEIKDKAKLTTPLTGEAYRQWCEKNAYCYELMLPYQESSHLFAEMRGDLERYFPYRATLERKSRKCLVLKVKSEAHRKQLLTKGGEPLLKDDLFTFSIRNRPWANFPIRLTTYFLQAIGKPIIDETGISGNVDFNIHAKMNDVAALKNELQRYGIDMVEEYRNIEMLLIEDRPKH